MMSDVNNRQLPNVENSYRFIRAHLDFFFSLVFLRFPPPHLLKSIFPLTSVPYSRVLEFTLLDFPFLIYFFDHVPIFPPFLLCCSSPSFPSPDNEVCWQMTRPFSFYFVPTCYFLSLHLSPSCLICLHISFFHHKSPSSLISTNFIFSLP